MDNQGQVSKEQVAEALAFFDMIEKAAPSVPIAKECIAGENANGGDSNNNTITREQIETHEATIRKMNEELSEMKKALGEKVTTEESATKEISNPKEGEDKADMKKSEDSQLLGVADVEIIAKALVTSAEMLKKAREENVDIKASLESLKETIESINPGRRTVSKVGVLQKGFTGESLSEDGKLTLDSTIHKSKVTNLLMKSLNSTPDDKSLESAIMTYEASGYLSEDIKKSIGDKNNVVIL